MSDIEDVGIRITGAAEALPEDGLHAARLSFEAARLMLEKLTTPSYAITQSNAMAHRVIDVMMAGREVRGLQSDIYETKECAQQYLVEIGIGGLATASEHTVQADRPGTP